MKAILFSFFLGLFSLHAWAADAENGKKLFATRGCVACHSLGSGEASKTGPDLEGVTKIRKASWLKSWIKNPDRMRNDPIIKKLTAQYSTPMPATGLSDQEVEDIVAYLKNP